VNSYVIYVSRNEYKTQHKPFHSGERAKSGDGLGEKTFCPRAEAKHRHTARLSAEPSRKTFFSFLEEFFGGARKIQKL